MSSTNSTLEDFDPPAKPKATPFIALVILALLVCAAGLVMGHAPFDPYISDWIGWARIEPTWAGVTICGVVLFVIGLFGTVRGLMPAKAPRPMAAPVRSRPVEAVAAASPAHETPVFTPAVVAESVMPEGLTLITPPAAEPRAEARGSLKFDASRLSASRGDEVQIEDAVAAPPVMTAPAEIASLEPAIFHDNASDSFFSQSHFAPEPVAAVLDAPAFDAQAALAPEHGLTIARPESAQIIPIRRDVAVPEAAPVAQDPLEAALLAEPVATPREAPQSDISAVIHSAMRFIDAPVEDAPVVESLPVAAPVVEAPAPIDGESEIRQAVQTALSVWPDATRAIAADELSVRISHLYYDPTPQSSYMFHMIASGDLGAASNALQTRAGELVQEGRSPEAAELWRVAGALHMGRDDGKAMAAYEKVSELDPSDANIHLYLARRYQMSGDSAKLPPVIGRALAVISDPSVRTELLTPYADLQMKAGHVESAGDALEELSRLHETTAYLRPDDIAARSAYAITVARLAQAREMHGAFEQAGPLYKKAHKVFSDLSAMKPEHPGLKAMADNALKDAQRFGA